MSATLATLSKLFMLVGREVEERGRETLRRPKTSKVLKLYRRCGGVSQETCLVVELRSLNVRLMLCILTLVAWTMKWNVSVDEAEMPLGS